MKEKSPKIYTVKQALKKAADYCAIQERSQQEMRNKLYLWGLYGNDVENIIALLISDGFINEERFAKAFTSGKFRIKKWGKIKIQIELKKKKISDYCIRKGFEEIDRNEYLKTLKYLIQKKSREVKEKNTYKKLSRLASYVISKGYESELVWDLLRNDFEE